MCNMRSVFVGSVLIVALNLVASWAIIVLTIGVAPLQPASGVTPQTIDRQHKADRLSHGNDRKARSLAMSAQVSSILVGCDAAFGPLSRYAGAADNLAQHS